MRPPRGPRCDTSPPPRPHPPPPAGPCPAAAARSSSRAAAPAPPGAGRRPAAARRGDVRAGQPPLVAGVGVVRDWEVPPCKGGLHVALGGRRRLPGIVDRLARTQQRLRRNARVVRALNP